MGALMLLHKHVYVYEWSLESVGSITVLTSKSNCNCQLSMPVPLKQWIANKAPSLKKHNLAKTRWLYQQCAALIWVLCYRNKQCARIQEMLKSPNKWKKPAGCSISTISLPSMLKLILTGVVLRSQELLHAWKKRKRNYLKSWWTSPRGCREFRGKKMTRCEAREEKRIE